MYPLHAYYNRGPNQPVNLIPASTKKVASSLSRVPSNVTDLYHYYNNTSNTLVLYILPDILYHPQYQQV